MRMLWIAMLAAICTIATAQDEMDYQKWMKTLGGTMGPLKKAVDAFNAELDVAKATGLRGSEKDLEYLQVYFNADAISEKDIDEVNPAEEVA